MKTVVMYIRLPGFMTQAANTNWIEFLRHLARNVCIDINEVSGIFLVMAAYRHTTGRTDRYSTKQALLSGKRSIGTYSTRKQNVLIILIRVYLMPFLYSMYLMLGGEHRRYRKYCSYCNLKTRSSKRR